VGSNADHSSTALKKFSLSENDDLKVRIWDTWGLTPQNYRNGELPKIVRGNLPSGWKMLDDTHTRTPKLEKALQRAKQNAIHALLVFVPVSSLRNAGSIAALQPLLTDVKACSNLNPIILLALSDEEVKATDKAKFRENPNGKFPELEAAMTVASKEFNVPRNRIAVSVPYTSETEKTFEIDRLVCKILELALQIAHSNLAYDRPDDDEDPDDGPEQKDNSLSGGSSSSNSSSSGSNSSNSSSSGGSNSSNSSSSGGSNSSSSSNPISGGLEAALEQLRIIRDKELITQEDFDREKKALLASAFKS